MVTGLDLIKWQLRIASGEAISFKQRDVREQGSAIECRINAEDPENGFRPCPGTIEHLRVPGGLGVRFDSHVYAGYTISPAYDSLIGKLIVHAPTRDEAIDRMLRCLEEFAIAPIKTTVPLHRQILDHRLFRHGRVHTSFVEQLG